MTQIQQSMIETLTTGAIHQSYYYHNNKPETTTEMTSTIHTSGKSVPIHAIPPATHIGTSP
ncbi:hypothetical protein ASPCADRAFT_212307 [Aspergillus carbonarius ITEM 5010]|uniref:Uncharacterized protein n=1 Tax=Aspergillus carbonarius (strain ITEM 5010) TaxID=602072 RepID=A0A1R3R6A6_ASPC5|nr:hypothetical protein ASPCADRAFT_212307 [Aspergillus carbonarius ITEM 5010]